jgi:hypothetical protein
MANDSLPLSPFSPEALDEFRDERDNRTKSRSVCVCGHSLSHHYESADGWMCTPAKSHCACVKARAVLVTDNLRMFMYSTIGIGSQHALGRGILACIDKDVQFEWLEKPLCCDMCGEETMEPIPVSQEPRTMSDGEKKLYPVGKTTKYNNIVCKECYLKQWS